MRWGAELTKVSNGHLSQLEHGVHEPSLRVLKAIADALNVSRETLFEQAGLMSPTENLDEQATEHAIRTDRRLTNTQRLALLAVYRTYVRENGNGA
jgi:transcriptional regulator with XRE-family HTH domain